ncbi:MAG TPA: hypothetical protein VG892_13745 [Terriglobales bacterium]|nr:hypothetical protein [Terriglobales bacterium]
MSDRKYSQRGYQDSKQQDSKPQGAGKSQKQQTPAARVDNYGPRAMNMPGKRSVTRCSECGTILPATGNGSGSCPKCGAALHSCKQCSEFDPAARFECRQLIAARRARKDAANTCEFFANKVTVERETSSGGGSGGTSTGNRMDDARRAFDNLFKK